MAEALNTTVYREEFRQAKLNYVKFRTTYDLGVRLESSDVLKILNHLRFFQQNYTYTYVSRIKHMRTIKVNSRDTFANVCEENVLFL